MNMLDSISRPALDVIAVIREPSCCMASAAVSAVAAVIRPVSRSTISAPNATIVPSSPPVLPSSATFRRPRRNDAELAHPVVGQRRVPPVQERAGPEDADLLRGLALGEQLHQVLALTAVGGQTVLEDVGGAAVENRREQREDGRDGDERRSRTGCSTNRTTAMPMLVSTPVVSAVTLFTMSIRRKRPELRARCSWS